MSAAAPGQRAPRLDPDDSIARHMTRVGRFRTIDPTKPGDLPHASRVIGVVAWAALLTESLRRARRARPR